ncbi:hypothetical protein OF83DRAFT_1089600 [Amylostereum chailletii]|nr:hypothetical protein OF83DRAFT_1089600 [Amylostereum chailletii]
MPGGCALLLLPAVTSQLCIFPYIPVFCNNSQHLQDTGGSRQGHDEGERDPVSLIAQPRSRIVEFVKVFTGTDTSSMFKTQDMRKIWIMRRLLMLTDPPARGTTFSCLIRTFSPDTRSKASARASHITTVSIVFSEIAGQPASTAIAPVRRENVSRGTSASTSAKSRRTKDRKRTDNLGPQIWPTYHKRGDVIQGDRTKRLMEDQTHFPTLSEGGPLISSSGHQRRISLGGEDQAALEQHQIGVKTSTVGWQSPTQGANIIHGIQFRPL